MSFDLRVALYNVKASGRKDYLAVGEDMLPTVYMVRSAALRSCHVMCHSHDMCRRMPAKNAAVCTCSW